MQCNISITLSKFIRIFYPRIIVSFRVQRVLFLSQSCGEESG